MGGWGFEVLHESLDRLANDLHELGGTIDSAMKGMDRGGDLGTDGLNSACDDFKSDWDYGVKDIKKKVGGIADNVSATAKLYDQADQASAQGLDHYRLPS